ncbi:MAG TPA: hypothetical protein V6D08_20615 [Candidatus Obscuribacterales bacterium]
MACLIFLALNGLAAATRFGHAAASEFPELSWAGWRIKHFLDLPAKPDVVLLGSSLVLVPVAGVEADYQNVRLDGTAHYRSGYLEKILESKTGRRLSTFNFSLPGEMPSDAYLITDFLLKGKRQPNLLVYGLGPRDFMDNLLPSPASTDPFRNLSRFGDVTPVSARAMPDWFERLNFELGKFFPLYGRKADITARTEVLAGAAVDRLAPRPAGGRPFSIADRRTLLPEYRRSQLGVGEAYFRPTRPEERTTVIDNLAEYRSRYARVKWDMFLTQMEFLADTAGLARSRGVHVVLVAMPITDVNRSLIQDYAWNAYLRSVKAIARVTGSTFIDLGEAGLFSRSDFGDTVHLHSGGGKKLLDLLADRLAGSQACRLALAVPGPDSTVEQRRLPRGKTGKPVAAVPNRAL